MDDMTRKQEHEIFKAALWAVAVVVLLTLLFGCGTRKTMTEHVSVHDTLIVHKTDTLLEVKVKEVRDTVRQTEKHYYTLNNVGDTIKEVHHYHDTQTTIIVDSTNRYQAKVDSLQAIIDKQKNTVKKTRQRLSWRDVWLVALVCIVALAAMIVLARMGKKD